MNAVQRHIRSMVEENEHIALIGVFDQEGSVPSFIYTVGMRSHGLPDIIMFCPIVQGTHDLMNLLFELARRGEIDLTADAPLDLGGHLRPYLIATTSESTRSVYTVQAGVYYGTDDYEVLQLVVPDKTGLFPWDSNQDPVYNVPILGEPPRVLN